MSLIIFFFSMFNIVDPLKSGLSLSYSSVFLSQHSSFFINICGVIASCKFRIEVTISRWEIFHIPVIFLKGHPFIFPQCFGSISAQRTVFISHSYNVNSWKLESRDFIWRLKPRLCFSRSFFALVKQQQFSNFSPQDPFVLLKYWGTPESFCLEGHINQYLPY